jgi:antitoxin component of MazEF toxin-antitoxin module
MVKTLTKHGNSLALVIDKPLLEMMRIDESTPLSVTMNGNCLVIAPAPDPARKKKFEAAKRDTFKKYDKMMKRLAE